MGAFLKPLYQFAYRYQTLSMRPNSSARLMKIHSCTYNEQGSSGQYRGLQNNWAKRVLIQQ